MEIFSNYGSFVNQLVQKEEKYPTLHLRFSPVYDIQ
jgi:hypothetical protein